MKLSQKEKELILELRKKEELELPQKIGYLKKDLYYQSESFLRFNPGFYTSEEKK